MTERVERASYAVRNGRDDRLAVEVTANGARIAAGFDGDFPQVVRGKRGFRDAGCFNHA